MVQKVQNLVTETTNDQLEIEWAQVFSKRNKLLEISDWTQLGDVFLLPEVKKQWSIWRQKLRKVNRKTFTQLQDAKDVLALLEKEIPKASPLDESEFNDKIVNAEETRDKIIQKVITKEQPIIIREIIEEPRFQELLRGVLDKDAYGMKNYLLSFLSIENSNIITDEDTLEVAKSKAKEYARNRQTITLNNKLSHLPDNRILQGRAEEAIEFLSAKAPDIENFPLIKLHSESMDQTYEQSAVNFLRQKKWYNQLLLDSEKFLFYTGKQIESAISKIQIQSIIDSIKYGY
jgi:hypothetical protein